MKKIKMGFIGAGWIAGQMAKTIAEMPEIEACAIAARDLDRAQRFASKNGFAKAYGSYEELVKDEEVQLVYVATPHSHHYEHAMLSLNNGKHVLCEKAFTANEHQAQELIDAARKNNLLITEAIWTRYMPSRKTIDDIIASDIIGKPTLLTANLGYVTMQNERMHELSLCGGALLDIGIYLLNFASMIFGDEIESVNSTAVFMQSGVDAMDSITICYKNGQMAVLNTSSLAQTNREGIIYGDKGYISIDNINNPECIHVISLDREEIASYKTTGQILGYEYEVRAAAKAIQEGALECPEMPHSETLRIMRIMDEIRESWGMRFPFEND